MLKHGNYFCPVVLLGLTLALHASGVRVKVVWKGNTGTEISPIRKMHDQSAKSLAGKAQYPQAAAGDAGITAWLEERQAYGPGFGSHFLLHVDERGRSLNAYEIQQENPNWPSVDVDASRVLVTPVESESAFYLIDLKNGSAARIPYPADYRPEACDSYFNKTSFLFRDKIISIGINKKTRQSDRLMVYDLRKRHYSLIDVRQRAGSTLVELYVSKDGLVYWNEYRGGAEPLNFVYASALSGILGR